MRHADGAQPEPESFPAWLARRRQEIGTGADLNWCTADLDSGAMLGNVQIFGMGPLQDRYPGEFGYWLRLSARRRSVIDDALKPVIAHAFTPVEDDGLELNRQHATTDSDNHPSQSILRSTELTPARRGGLGRQHLGLNAADGNSVSPRIALTDGFLKAGRDR